MITITLKKFRLNKKLQEHIDKDFTTEIENRLQMTSAKSQRTNTHDIQNTAKPVNTERDGRMAERE